VGAAREALEKTLALRSALRSIFGSLAVGIAPDQEAITGLNRFVREAQGHMHLVGSGSEYDWEWLVDDDLVRVPWPVARSAAVLLVSEQLSRVRICDADTCRWLFLDTSKSGRRRWCDMKVCGNRAKARRHYARTQSGGVDDG
jgi:predicted RNA-binding Zn ribbon-like protein